MPANIEQKLVFAISPQGQGDGIMMFGAKNHDEAMKVMGDAIAATGQAYLDERQKDFSIKPKEACSVCAHCRGPIVLACGNPQSEFFEKPVHPIGWCDRFAAKVPA